MMDILKALALPSNIIFLLIAFGLLVRLLFGWRRLAFACLALAGLSTLILSSGFVATSLLSPLEYRYPALHDPAGHPDSRHIVVLASYANNDSLMPISSRIDSSAAFRILHTFDLYRQCSECRIIVTGEDSDARLMGQILSHMGVVESRMILEGNSYNTARSAENLFTLLGDSPFFLVTSAGHMPRSMGVFEKRGMRPIPAPTDFQLPKDPLDALLLPRPKHLHYSDLAVHEYMAMAWFRLNGDM